MIRTKIECSLNYYKMNIIADQHVFENVYGIVFQSDLEKALMETSPGQKVIRIGTYLWIVSSDRSMVRRFGTEKWQEIVPITFRTVINFPAVITSDIIYMYNDSSIMFLDNNELCYMKISRAEFSGPTVRFEKDHKVLVTMIVDTRVKVLTNRLNDQMVPLYIDFDGLVAYYHNYDRVSLTKIDIMN